MERDSKKFLLIASLLSVTASILVWTVSGQLGQGSGFEMSAIAERIVLGFGFSSPYLPPADIPTTMSPPLYVWLVAVAYKWFGIKTLLSRELLQCLNLVFHLVTLALLYSYCEILISSSCARVFAILFAVHPSIIFLGSNVWESSLTLMLLTIAFYVSAVHFDRLQFPGWFAYGLLLGLIALSNPVWSIGYPFLCVGAFYFGGGSSWRRMLIGTAVVLLGFLVAVSPWMWRNYAVTHQVIFVRGMPGTEWFKGNNAEAWGGHGDGFAKYYLYSSPSEREKLASMGETAYDAMMMKEARAAISGDPARYLLVTLARVGQWWSGDIDLTLWHLQGKRHREFAMGVVLILIGTITSVLGLVGMWQLRERGSSIWQLWVYIFVLPVPYYFVIIGFRYQASHIPFLLIPVAYALASKWRSMPPKRLLK